MTRRGAVIALAAFPAARARAADPDLRLSLSSAQSRYTTGQPIIVHWQLENLAHSTLNIVAFHEAGAEPQFDELQVWIGRNGGQNRQVPMVGPRAAVRAVWKELAPGASLDQQFDLTRAASAGGLVLGPGDYRITAAYAMRRARSPEGAAAWEGTVQTAVPLEISVSQ